jgi:hypothetical protein
MISRANLRINGAEEVEIQTKDIENLFNEIREENVPNL